MASSLSQLRFGTAYPLQCFRDGVLRPRGDLEVRAFQLRPETHCETVGPASLRSRPRGTRKLQAEILDRGYHGDTPINFRPSCESLAGSPGSGSICPGRPRHWSGARFVSHHVFIDSRKPGLSFGGCIVTNVATRGRVDRLTAEPCGSLVDHKMTSPALPSTCVVRRSFNPGLK